MVNKGNINHIAPHPVYTLRVIIFTLNTPNSHNFHLNNKNDT